MTSAAWEAMEMGLDPVCGPDGQLWEESTYKRPAINREIFGDDDDGAGYGKIDMDGGGHYGHDDPPGWFANFAEAREFARSNPGKVIVRSPSGTGFIIKR